MVVAGALFALLALVAAIVTDLHDRDFPQAIGAQSRLGLDFGESRLSDQEAFAMLTQADADWHLGLVKIAPDLAGGGHERVFVALNDTGLPATFRWFSGASAGRVVGRDRLANSPPGGSYLVTGDGGRLSELETRLSGAGVRVTRTDASVIDSLRFTMREGGFGTAVLAAFALIAALALFWLSMKARSRALRVLGGCPALRIQAQDLGGFAGALLLPAGAVTLAAAAYVWVSHGRLFVGPLLKALSGLEFGVIAVSLLVALAMSASAWPSAAILATRQPAVKSLRSAAAVIQALTFLLVVATAGPAWSAYRSSAATAAEMAQWENLADQVSVQFGMSDAEMTAVEPQIGDLVEDAESVGAVAYSYTFSRDVWRGDLGDYSAVTFVNQRWLDLMTARAPANALAPVPYDRVKALVNREFGETFALLARNQGRPSEETFSGFAFRQPVGGFRLPVGEGGDGGSLRFLGDVLVAVVPSLHLTINDRNLTSMVSTRNLVFTGVAATQALLERHGLSAGALSGPGIKGGLSVVYVAEEGLLRAQFMAYVVWLMNLALAALVVAFTVAAAISALITALLHAKRDFPLRLSGRSWPQILQRRVTRELLAGAVLVTLVALLQRPDATGALLVAAVFGVLVVPLSHLCAANWCFAGVSRRRI
ncbi:hypothetical protein [Dactylosporangium sp. NPDC051484]|uniref:hypothetical protein n=1 Tax=Dactylosporangium sp. NPDC051484 TaxID=3154942 RepID=UPI00344FD0C1